MGREELCLVLPAGAAATPKGLEGLDALGFIAHPDGFSYADELFSLNFPETFHGADRLRVRAFVNQIGQIPTPVAHGIGYTLLPRSGVNAYPDKEKLRVARLSQTRHHDLWLVLRRGRTLPMRVSRIAELVHSVASRLGDQ